MMAALRLSHSPALGSRHVVHVSFVIRAPDNLRPGGQLRPAWTGTRRTCPSTGGSPKSSRRTGELGSEVRIGCGQVGTTTIR